MSFVHLNVHSHYSRGWGIPTVEDLCGEAQRLGFKRLALTDTNSLYGLVFFIRAALEAGIEPIAGSELVSAGRRALLLVKTKQGYANLSSIISDCQCRRDFDLTRALKEARNGLIILSDDFSLLKTLKRDSMEDLFVEMSPGYQMGPCHAFSRKSGIPPAATNRVYLLERGQFHLHRILRAVTLNTKLTRLGFEDTCREHNVMNGPKEMTALFPHAPEAAANTMEIAERCLWVWDHKRPVFPCFRGMTDSEAFHRLCRETMKGCLRRYGEITPAVKARIDHEMAIIRDKNFAHYFLVVADLTGKARRSCGRGSAAASIVSYALGITHVDPLRHNLFFERFLNPGRMDPPDIDVDFAWDERDRILDDAFALYGTRRAAMVANHNTFGARSAIREVAKVFGLTEREIGRVTARIGFGWHLKQIRDELQHHPKMKDIEFREPWAAILDAASKLEDRFHRLSTHCGGLVVVPDDIRRYCPVEISAGGHQVLQWEKDSVEHSRLVKIDILGNRSLAVIRDGLRLVEINRGRRIDYADLNPVDDPETVRIFHEGDTFGVFYFESPATRQVLHKVRSGIPFRDYLKMDHFQVNVTITSLIRPASNRSIDTWVSRLHGRPWEPVHPLLTPVLEETLGVMVFQEQLSLAAIHLAGFGPAEADTLRKIVAKKHREKRLHDFHRRFEKGAAAKGVDAETAGEVWRMMMGFDGYSFCKPHSASYTMVAYKAAFLKAHFPAEFMAAVLSNRGGYYSTFGYISEARRMGLKVLPPDINLSEFKYTGGGNTIRVGLMQLKGLSADALDAVLYDRNKHGPFRSLDDCLNRVGNRVCLEEVRTLIKGGCFDRVSGGLPRPSLMWKTLESFARKDSCPTLFDPNPVSSNWSADPSVMKPYPRSLALRHESETLGFVLSLHPLEFYKHLLKNINFVRAKDLPARAGKRVTAIGWLITGKTVRTAAGEPMKFISFEDPSGIYEAVFFPETYNRFCHMLSGGRPYILRGRVEENMGTVTLNVNWIGFLDRHSFRAAG